MSCKRQGARRTQAAHSSFNKGNSCASSKTGTIFVEGSTGIDCGSSFPFSPRGSAEETKNSGMPTSPLSFLGKLRAIDPLLSKGTKKDSVGYRSMHAEYGDCLVHGDVERVD